MSNNKTFTDRAVSAGMEDRLPDSVRVALADAAREVAAAGGPVTYLELCYVDANLDPETGETFCEAPVSEDAADFSAVYFRSPETCDSTMLACDLEGLSPRAVAAACRALARQYGVPVLDRRLTTHDATPNGCAFHPDGVYGPVTGASRAPRPDRMS